MDTTPLPGWLPESVREYAGYYGYGDEYSNRLLTNPAMKAVWKDLGRRLLISDALQNLESWQRLYTDRSFSDNERGVAALYAVCLFEMRKQFAMTQNQVETQAEKWRDIALNCRAIWSVDYSPLHDPELADALKRTADHFDYLAGWLEQRAQGPRWLGRGYGENHRHDASVRARVTSFIVEADKLFGGLRTTLATMSSVALATTINPTEIDNWRRFVKL